jgi:hypothetical protein
MYLSVTIYVLDQKMLATGLYLLFFLIKKVTKKSRLQKNRLKFTAFRYAEIAKHHHYLQMNHWFYHLYIAYHQFRRHASFRKFLNAIFLRPTLQ